MQLLQRLTDTCAVRNFRIAREETRRLGTGRVAITEPEQRHDLDVRALLTEVAVGEALLAGTCQRERASRRSLECRMGRS